MLAARASMRGRLYHKITSLLTIQKRRDIIYIDTHDMMKRAYSVFQDKYYSNENKITRIGVLNNAYNGYADCGIYKYALKIPSAKLNGEDFQNIKEFASSMSIIEEELLNTLES